MKIGGLFKTILISCSFQADDTYYNNWIKWQIQIKAYLKPSRKRQVDDFIGLPTMRQ